MSTKYLYADGLSIHCSNCGANNIFYNEEEVKEEQDNKCKICGETFNIGGCVHYEEIYKEGYECTDLDQMQYVKTISEDEYEIIDHNEDIYVDLTDYTDEELESEISAYYPSLEELKELYEGTFWKQVAAECIAEQS